jgi:glutaminase
MIANEKEIARMSTVQERIQENEHRLILNRQSLARMENSSWRHMSYFYSALGCITDPSTQGLSLYERTIARLKVEIDELEETNIILRREGAQAEAREAAKGSTWNANVCIRREAGTAPNFRR